MTTTNRNKTVMQASLWMMGLSLALFWLPLLGGLISGFVGGRKAGALGPAVVAVFLPGAIYWLLSIFLGGFLAGLPIIGAIFAMGGVAVASMHTVPLLIGAAIGGASSR